MSVLLSGKPGAVHSRGGLTTKIHAIVDAAEKAMALSLTPGQRADITEAEPLLDEVDSEALQLVSAIIGH